tara:strand:- start:5707 stop:6606 length:900 start_codon:yes stop_codon:yes gene_type:complete
LKKVVVTGSNGLLGQTLIDKLIESPNHKVYGFSRGQNRHPNSDFSYISIDLTDKEELRKSMEEIRPDTIINTAAMTHVDVCEQNKEDCDKVNVAMVASLVSICEELDIHLIHLSTDFVFDGQKGIYKETDAVNPLSYYAASKVKSEEIIKESKAVYTILRTILVYGSVHDMSRTNIVLWVLNALKNNQTITVVHDQYRMPTSVDSLAEACVLAMDNKVEGVFHISSSQLMSVYQIAFQVAQEFGLNTKLIQPISSEALNQPANRPRKTGFDLSKSESELKYRPKSFKEELLAFKSTYSE